MDQIYFWILILLFIIILLDYTDKYFKKEHFVAKNINNSSLPKIELAASSVTKVCLSNDEK